MRLPSRLHYHLGLAFGVLRSYGGKGGSVTRIVAGEFGGRQLAVPAKGTRPTSDRVREALFSKLEHDGCVAGANVLDLFSGSGALGLEAVSRGARQATLVDSARDAVKVATENVKALGVPDRVRVVSDDAERYTAAMCRAGGLAGANLRIAPADGNPALQAALAQQAANRAVNLVLMDPPYDYSEADLTKVLGNLVRTGLLVQGAVIVVERSNRSPEPTWPFGLASIGKKTYGETAVYFAEPVNAPELPAPAHAPPAPSVSLEPSAAITQAEPDDGPKVEFRC